MARRSSEGNDCRDQGAGCTRAHARKRHVSCRGSLPLHGGLALVEYKDSLTGGVSRRLLVRLVRATAITATPPHRDLLMGPCRTRWKCRTPAARDASTAHEILGGIDVASTPPNTGQRPGRCVYAPPRAESSSQVSRSVK